MKLINSDKHAKYFWPKWTERLEMGYGFGYCSGWKGLGIYYIDKNFKMLWSIDDSQSNTEDEMMWNDLMRMTILEVIGDLPKKRE